MSIRLIHVQVSLANADKILVMGEIVFITFAILALAAILFFISINKDIDK
jgi:hypothetical protein